MHSSASNANSKNKYSFPSSGRNALLMCTRENLPLHLHTVFVRVSRVISKVIAKDSLSIKVFVSSYSSQITLNSWGETGQEHKTGM